MSKRAYTYHLRLEQVAGIQPDSPRHEPLELELANHDDLFRIIGLMQQRNPFQEPGQATEFAIRAEAIWRGDAQEPAAPAVRGVCARLQGVYAAAKVILPGAVVSCF